MHLDHIEEPEEENPELALKHFGRGIDFLRSGAKAKAVKEFRRTLRYDPDFVEARAKLEELGESLGENP